MQTPRRSTLPAPNSVRFAVLLFACVVLYAPSWMPLPGLWFDADSRYTHGWLLAFAVGGLLFASLRSAAGLPPRRQLRVSLLLIVPLSLAWLLAFLSGLTAGAQVLALFVLSTAAFAVLPFAAALRSASLLLVLLTAVPIWDHAGPYLQQLTRDVVAVLIGLTGIPGEIDGYFVQLPAGVFEIAEGCNGLQILIAALSLGGLTAWLSERGVRGRLAIVLSFAVAGLVANWLRVYVVILAGYLTDMQHYLVRQEHYTLGWSLFAVFAAILVFTFRPSRDALQSADRPAGRAALPFAAVLAAGCGPVLLALLAVVSKPEFAELPPPGGDWLAEPTASLDGSYSLRQTVALRSVTTGRTASLFVERHALTAALSPRERLIQQAGFSYGRVLERHPQFDLLQVVDVTGRQGIVLLAYRSRAGVAGTYRNVQLRCGISKLLLADTPCASVMLSADCSTSCADAIADTTELYARYSEHTG
ncbi:MAG: archaeosortase/exosortase family protein [Pseudomonadota bacterium]